MIGWYIHHHGRGHLTRATAVREWLRDEVTVLSSLPAPDGAANWVRLPLDVDDRPVHDATAHGRLHWAPLHNVGLRQRMADIVGWIATAKPRLMVVDVSVEVTLLARLSGVAVIVVAGPGDRDDPTHQLAYDVAEHIIAPWPRAVYDPTFLRRHRHKTSYVGAFSRFDQAAAAPAAEPLQPAVLVLSGGGGSELTAGDLSQARAAVPGRTWHGAGLPGEAWQPELWPMLTSAEIVVTHAGQNALAEVAAARRPTVIVPQPRPFDEQVRVAEALHHRGLAVTVPAWPTPAAWPGVLDAALALGGQGWRQWSTGHGAQMAADVITEVAQRC